MNKRFSSAALCAALLASLTLPVGALDVAQARSLLEEHHVDPLPPAAYAAQSVEELLASLNDRYTVYYTAEEYDAFLQQVNGEEMVGIGVSILNAFLNGFEILSVLPNSPAAEAGLIPGESITAVNGAVLGPADSPAALIAGEAGTDVTVTLLSPDGTVRDVTMTRRTVQMPIVAYEQAGSVGYILCESFGDSTSDAVREAITAMNADTSVWVMDLRDNPGGTSTAASKTAGAFLGPRAMVYFRDGSDTYFQTSTTANSKDLTDKPLIILTSGRSASAAELFSAAIRDHRGGIAIGSRTYGKGVAQKMFDSAKYPDIFTDDALKITTYRFFSPDGATSDAVGVIPTLLMDRQYAETAAFLLSAPVPRSAIYAWKLELCNHTFYLDEELCRAEPETFTALLEALPPSAQLFFGVGTKEWLPLSVGQVAERFGLTDYTPRLFPDVADHLYAEEINTLRTYELLAGDENGLFHPDATLTRGELAAMLAGALNLPAGANTFSDVDETAWYAQAVSAVAARGFMQGDGTGAFRPEATLTNQELYAVYSAVAIWASMDGHELAQKDVSAVQWAEFYAYPEWAQGPARNLDKLGLIVDRDNPNDCVTRGDAAGLLCTLLKNIHILWTE